MTQTANAPSTSVYITQLAEENQIKLTRVGRSRRQYKTDCPFCGDRKQNLELNVDKQVFHCWACGVGGGMVRFYALLHNVSEFVAKEHLYPTRSGKPRWQHPALHLSREQLKLIGFQPLPPTKPKHLSDKEWFSYRRRALNWVWSEWKKYEAWKCGFDQRMDQLFAERHKCESNERIEQV